MDQYRFEIVEGGDPNGSETQEIALELTDITAARVQALKFIGRLLVDHAQQIEPRGSIRLTVADVQSTPRFSVVVSVQEATP